MNNSEKLSCVLCSECFDSKLDLQTHFRKHGDPKFKKQQSTSSDIQKKSENNTDEKVSCDVCTEVFSTISKAITHKHKVHPSHDTKYFCPWCGKLFTMKHLYDKHISTTHETEDKESVGFHCDSCNVDFFLFAAVTYHNKFFHRQDELPNIGYSRKHMMLDQELVQLFYCAFCGDEYFNKVNLHMHMASDHGDEDQAPDDIMRCPLCEAVFYHLDAYEIHLTFHSDQDLYVGMVESPNNDVKEFNLETVPPLLEKVENAEEEQADEAQEEDIIEADQLLKMLQNSQGNDDNDESNDRHKKKKKHKKHKKSKKETITLDEFLNMNTDLFGEGVDVHGIEEVPSQVVKKQLKTKLKPIRTQLPSGEIARLKKQGITIKPKANRVTIRPNANITSNNTKVASQIKNQNIIGTDKVMPKPNTKELPADVISKLLSKGLSVTKKSNTENIESHVLNESSDDFKLVDKVQDIPSENFVDNKVSNDESLLNTREDFHDPSPDKDEDNIVDKETTLIDTDPSVSKTGSDTSSNIIKNLSKNFVIKSVKSSTSSSPFTSTENNQLVLYDPEKVKKLSDDEKEVDSSECNLSNTNIKKNDICNFSKSPPNHLEALKSLGITVKSTKKEETTEHINQQSLPKDDVFKAPQNIVKKARNFSNVNKTLTNNEIKSIKVGMSANQNQTILVKNEHDLNLDNKTVSESLNELNQSESGFLKGINSQITIKSLKPQTDNQESISKPMSDIDDIEDQIPKTEVINKNLLQTHNTIAKQKLPNMQRQIKNFPISNHTNKIIEIKSPKAASEENNPNSAVIRNLDQITFKAVNQHQVHEDHEIDDINYEEDFDDDEKEYIARINSKQVIRESNQAKPVNTSSQISTETKEMRSPTGKLSQKASVNQNEVLKKLGGGITIKSPSLQKGSIKENNEIEDQEVFHIDDSDSDEFSQQPIKKRNEGHAKVTQLSDKQTQHNNMLKNLSKLVTITSVNKKSNSEDEEQFVEDDDIENELESSTNQNHVRNSNLVGKKVIRRENNGNRNYSVKPDLIPSEDNQIAIYKPPNESSDDEIPDFPEYYSEEEQVFDGYEDFPEQNDSIKSNSMSALRNLNFDCEDDKTKSDAFQTTLNKLKNINPNLCIKTPSNGQPSTSKIQPLKSSNNRNVPMGIKRVAPTPEDNNLLQTKAKQIKVSPNSSQLNSGQGLSPATVSNKLATSQTVNQEVTTSVKTIQTKTVVQEITTTVTKTIKTVNQVEQQASNSSINVKTMNAPSTSGPRIVQGMRPRFLNPPRQRAPCFPTRPTLAPNVRSTIRGTNTAIRQPLTSARVVRPQNVTKIIPNKSTPVGNKTLKISPNISKQTTQTLNSYKTESVSQQGGNIAKSSFVSQSNFSSSKLVESNNAGTTSQIKTAESCSTSQQQFSKLSNISGLKIVRNSQSQQQTVKSIETDHNVGKRSAFDAIEKLRKQGLVIKKPRVEDEEPPDSDPEEFYSDYEDSQLAIENES